MIVKENITKKITGSMCVNALPPGVGVTIVMIEVLWTPWV